MDFLLASVLKVSILSKIFLSRKGASLHGMFFEGFFEDKREMAV
jgi:hypothetical protein